MTGDVRGQERDPHEVDRVGRPLEEYPYPGPAWLLTRTARGAVGLLLGGLFELALAALTTYDALPRTSWWWLEVALFVLIGIPTAAGGAMSAWCTPASATGPHRRTDPTNGCTTALERRDAEATGLVASLV